MLHQSAKKGEEFKSLVFPFAFMDRGVNRKIRKEIQARNRGTEVRHHLVINLDFL